MAVTEAGVLVALATFAVGYVIGSLPLSALVGQAAGVDPYADGEGNPGSANVWRLAGPGWGLLALVADLARGMLPVLLATVTFGWWAGWSAGLGAVVGALWPALGQLRGGRGIGVLAGVLTALAPAAGFVAALLALATALGSRLAGRTRASIAVRIGLAAYPVLVLLSGPSLPELVAIAGLYAVVAARGALARRGLAPIRPRP